MNAKLFRNSPRHFPVVPHVTRFPFPPACPQRLRVKPRSRPRLPLSFPLFAFRFPLFLHNLAYLHTPPHALRSAPPDRRCFGWSFTDLHDASSDAPPSIRRSCPLRRGAR